MGWGERQRVPAGGSGLQEHTGGQWPRSHVLSAASRLSETSSARTLPGQRHGCASVLGTPLGAEPKSWPWGVRACGQAGLPVPGLAGNRSVSRPRRGAWSCGQKTSGNSAVFSLLWLLGNSGATPGLHTDSPRLPAVTESCAPLREHSGEQGLGWVRLRARLHPPFPKSCPTRFSRPTEEALPACPLSVKPPEGVVAVPSKSIRPSPLRSMSCRISSTSRWVRRSPSRTLRAARSSPRLMQPSPLVSNCGALVVVRGHRGTIHSLSPSLTAHARAHTHTHVHTRAYGHTLARIHAYTHAHTQAPPTP